MRRSLILTSILSATFIAVQLSAVLAGIVYDGNLDPEDPNDWTTSTTAYVGKTADGALEVNGGSLLYSRYGYIGYEDKATGQVTITGSGSKWTNSYYIYVGEDGDGTLNITGGGAVENTYSAYIGRYSGSNGVVKVDGDGSSWTNGSSLDVGYYTGSTGTLNITGGGAVANTSGYIGIYSGSSGEVSVNGEGSTWTNSSSLYVGDGGSGTLSIAGGGSVSNSYGYIGDSSSASGEVSVNASTWTNSSYLYVGNNGSGTLSIAGGGAVANTTAYIGRYAGSTGDVSVDASTWTNSGDLYVGYDGDGTLSISNAAAVSATGTTYVGFGKDSTGAINFGPGGGTFTTGSLAVSPSQLTGTGTITAQGLVSDVALVFDSTTSLNQTVNLTPTISVDLRMADDPANNGALGAGWKGAGSLAIENGVEVKSKTGYLGFAAGSEGTATIAGSGSKWTNSGVLYVGNYGTGTMNVSAGAVVSNSTAYIGQYAGSSGTVSVDASTWTNSGNLYVGNEGDGSLTIAGGGSVSASGTTYVGLGADSTGTINFGPGGGTLTTRSLAVSPSQLSGTGTINTKGLIGDLDLVFDSIASLTQTLVFNGQSGRNVTVNLNMTTPTSNCDLGAGWKGTGSLTVQNGVAVASQNGYLGHAAGSNGTATVSGPGSTWNNVNYLYVGNYGGGTLNVADGGCVANGGLIPGVDSPFPGYSPIGIAFIGDNAGSTGTANVDGPGSVWSNSSDLYIGYGGVGTINVTNGGYLSNGYSSNYSLSGAIIGGNSGSSGTATIDGAGSTWVSNSPLTIGYLGNGTLNISNGGLVTSINFTSSYSTQSSSGIGAASGSTGTVSIDGAGSTWINSGYIIVAGSGNGTLNVTNGGLLSSSYTSTSSSGSYVGSIIGSLSGSNGTVNIDGAGSRWISTGTITVGNNSSNYYPPGDASNGTLNVLDGGFVRSTGVYVGASVSSVGTATVDGDGSTLAVGGSLYVGGSSSSYPSSSAIAIGTLNVTGGGLVTSSGSYIGFYPSSTGTVNVDGSGSRWIIAGDLAIGYQNYSYSTPTSATLNVTGGAAVSNAAGNIGFNNPTYYNTTCTATVAGEGSTWTNTAGLNIGYSGAGTLNLDDGGTLVSNSVAGSSGIMILNFDGGILKPYNASNTAWITHSSYPPPTSGVFIKEGGAILDTLGYVMGIGVPLQHGGDDPADGGLTKRGPGSLTLSAANTYTGRTVVEEGTLRLSPPAHNAVLNLGGADIQHPDAKLVFLYTPTTNPAATVRDLLAESHAAGWADGQFLCTIADGEHGLGWFDDAANSQLIVQYAFYGDANLDNSVDLLDLTVLGGNWRGEGKVWNQGDFNYDGAVDLLDLTILGGNWRASAAGLTFAEALKMVDFAPVPEPGTLALLAAAALGPAVFARRRR